MNGIKLLSTGSALPRRAVTNDDMARIVDTNDEWIATRTGIRSRYHCTEGESHTSLCLAAAKQALERAGIGPEQIGVCIVATLSQDFLTPAAACILQRELGFPEDTVCFDLNAACSGFVYGLHTAECLLSAAGRKYGLVVGVEALSRITDFTDRSTCVLFGDGAAAAVIRLTDDAPYACVLGARGDTQILRAGGAGEMDRFIHMDGPAVFRFAVDAVPKCIDAVLAQAGMTLSQVDHVICHQANSRIIDYVVRKLKAPPEKFYKNMDRYGNTSAASIPIALDELLEKGLARQGQIALCVGFGAGLTWGGALLKL